MSADGGHTWQTADLAEGRAQNPARAWAWTFWECEVPVPVQPAHAKPAAGEGKIFDATMLPKVLRNAAPLSV